MHLEIQIQTTLKVKTISIRLKCYQTRATNPKSAVKKVLVPTVLQLFDDSIPLLLRESLAQPIGCRDSPHLVVMKTLSPRGFTATAGVCALTQNFRSHT